jgi:hypothetical protein
MVKKFYVVVSRNFPPKFRVLARYAMRGYIKLEHDRVGDAGGPSPRQRPVAGYAGETFAAYHGGSGEPGSEAGRCKPR